ncbi:ThuA domain-containing protein [candidate division KSB1 bacterium]|nr:ThuA domain-containing protein [candidate division KSB1 bacterium]
MKTNRMIFGILILFGAFNLEAQTDNQFDVLVYAAPDFWHGPAIPTAIQSLEKMAEKYQFGLTWTQDNKIFNEEKFFNFAAIVFLNSNADDFSEIQKVNFEKYIANGGGFVGIHAASVTDKKWTWYTQLVGRVFSEHPEVQFGVLRVLDKKFPATMHLPDQWLWSDEWYTFETEPLANSLNVLMTVDESTYDPKKDWGRGEMKGMGDFHPIAWYQEFNGGRSFYTALGHMPGLYLDEIFLAHIVGGIYWAATGKGICN